MQYINLKTFLFLLVVALIAGAFNLKGLEWLASDAAKWVLLGAILLVVVRMFHLNPKK